MRGEPSVWELMPEGPKRDALMAIDKCVEEQTEKLKEHWTVGLGVLTCYDMESVMLVAGTGGKWGVYMPMLLSLIRGIDQHFDMQEYTHSVAACKKTVAKGLDIDGEYALVATILDILAKKRLEAVAK